MKINELSFSLLIKQMLEGRYTIEELAERTGLHYVTVGSYTRALHKAGAAHIVGWSGTGRSAKRIYKIGNSWDQPKQRPLTSAERRARYRSKRGQHQSGSLQEGLGGGV